MVHSFPTRRSSDLDFVRRGGEIVNAEVRGFEIGSAGPTAIATDRGPMPVDFVVIAARPCDRDTIEWGNARPRQPHNSSAMERSVGEVAQGNGKVTANYPPQRTCCGYRG